jgi:hypothetical protein
MATPKVTINCVARPAYCQSNRLLSFLSTIIRLKWQF